MRGLGIDAAGAHGWVGVVVDRQGLAGVHLAAGLAEVIAAADGDGRVDAIGVDIPIGLPDGPRRSAEVEARAFVGPRRSSVFSSPHRSALDHADQASANLHLASLEMPKVSAQFWALLPRIREAAVVAAADDRVVEVFPEASFRQLAGRPLAHGKRAAAGILDRLALLAGAEPPIMLPTDLGPAGACPLDDVFDAAAAAWTARRVARGEALALGDPGERDPETGRRMAIWV